MIIISEICSLMISFCTIFISIFTFVKIYRTNRINKIYDKAYKGDISILSDKYAIYHDSNMHELTPLHHLAQHGNIKILKHPMVDKIKCSFNLDSHKLTPFDILHYVLRNKYSKEGLRHMMKLIQRRSGEMEDTKDLKSFDSMNHEGSSPSCGNLFKIWKH